MEKIDKRMILGNYKHFAKMLIRRSTDSNFTSSVFSVSQYHSSCL